MKDIEEGSELPTQLTLLEEGRSVAEVRRVSSSMKPIDSRLQEHVEGFLRMLAPNAKAYAYAGTVFGHLTGKFIKVRAVWRQLMWTPRPG